MLEMAGLFRSSGRHRVVRGDVAAASPLLTLALAGRMGRVCETADGLEFFSLLERRSR